MTLDLKSWPMSMPGSKRRMIAKLWPNIPRPRQDGGRFVVPFFGTGVDSAHFVNEGYQVVASDAHPMLVRMHHEFEYVIRLASGWTKLAQLDLNDARAMYFELRDGHNIAPEPWSLYTLNRHAHSQLLRHNREGKFNAPFGELRKIPSPEVVASHVAFIGSIEGPTVMDFGQAMQAARIGDSAYLDPPYYGTFDAYTGQPFDTPRLLSEIVKLRDRGIPGAMSNSPAIADLLPSHGLIEGEGVTVHPYTRAGTITVSMQARQPVAEVLVVWEGRQ